MTTPGHHYARTRQRLTGLLDELGAEHWDTPVAACPGWRVRDVIGHLAGTVEDAMAGRIQGIPTTEQTAEQVDRHRDDDPAELVAGWNRSAPPFEDLVSQLEIWPATFDAVSHEHDIRTALDRPGARDDETVRTVARLALQVLRAPATVTVDFGDEIVTSRGDGTAGTYRLETTPFEILRLRLGRRTREEVRSLRWDRDPDAILDHLFIFGPTPTSIGE